MIEARDFILRSSQAKTKTYVHIDHSPVCEWSLAVAKIWDNSNGSQQKQNELYLDETVSDNQEPWNAYTYYSISENMLRERNRILYMGSGPSFISVAVTRHLDRSNSRGKVLHSGFQFQTRVHWYGKVKPGTVHALSRAERNECMCLLACWAQLNFSTLPLFRTPCIGNGATQSRLGLTAPS